MVKKNFYEHKIFEIKSLIANNETNKALKLLNEELSLSYIPEKYEQEFTQLFLAIAHDQKAEEKTLTPISIETFLAALSSTNNFKLALALNAMHELNLHRIAQEIKQWIEDKNNNNRIAKIYMFEAMSEQNIDLDLEFEKHIINPQKFGSIFAKSAVINVFHELEKLTHKKPFLTNLVSQNFKSYLLVNYPKVNFKANLALMLIRITEHMLDSNKKLTNAEKIIYQQIKTLN